MLTCPHTEEKQELSSPSNPTQTCSCSQLVDRTRVALRVATEVTELLVFLRETLEQGSSTIGWEWVHLLEAKVLSRIGVLHGVLDPGQDDHGDISNG